MVNCILSTGDLKSCAKVTLKCMCLWGKEADKVYFLPQIRICISKGIFLPGTKLLKILPQSLNEYLEDFE